MNTTAVRLYAKNDVRLETFALPEIKDDEILLEVHADSICMSTWKAIQAGKDHNRVPDDVAENPIIIGHEFAGVIAKVGAKWADEFSENQLVTIQPALNYKGSMASPGYSYKYCGGDATYIILPPEVMIVGALLPVKTDAYFKAALSEPYSCVIGAMHSLYRSSRQEHKHTLGVKAGGKLAILGGCGPMGLAALDYALSLDGKPAKIVVTDMDEAKINRAKAIFDPIAAERGIPLQIVSTKGKDEFAFLSGLTDGALFDDIMIMVPVPAVIELADKLLSFNGCMNFFAGPVDHELSAKINFYNVHYFEKHIVGTTGGNNDDQKEALSLMEKSLIHPEALITHVGGLDSAGDASCNLPKIPGGKKLIYTHKKFPLVALDELEERKGENPLFAGLAPIVAKNGGLWSVEAEKYVLSNAESI